jgi:hypothetical protein
MSRHVRGSLFSDYVRMMRHRKDVDWAGWLDAEDLPFLSERIDPDGWYPMATFERMGIAIIESIGAGDLESVRTWGRASVEHLIAAHPRLLAPDDPRESLMRFQIMRQTFFDFPAVTVRELSDLEARVVIAYGMSARAEAAASHQAMGFFEQLLERAGAARCEARFIRRSWAGDTETLLMLQWSRPSGAPGSPRAPRGM